VNEPWYEGGSLLQATCAAWRQAPYANKLATCGDFFMKLWEGATYNAWRAAPANKHATDAEFFTMFWESGAFRRAPTGFTDATIAKVHTIQDLRLLAEQLVTWIDDAIASEAADPKLSNFEVKKLILAGMVKLGWLVVPT